MSDIKQLNHSWDANMEIEFLSNVQKTLELLKNDLYQFIRVQHIINNAKRNNKTVYICGNGGSASTASHFACDLFKIAGVRAISLDENVPLMTAIINDEGWENLYIDQLKRLFNKGDVLIAISVHGGSGSDKAELWSQNLLKAIEYANKNGGLTIGLSGCDGGNFKNMCDTNIIVKSESTPVVESVHCLVAHLVAVMINEKSNKQKNQRSVSEASE